jgi:protein-S-isoprenylcysteine O-methyltransferase Ste14
MQMDIAAISVVESASVTIDPRPIIGISWLVFFIAWFIMAMIYGGGGRRSNDAAAIGLRVLMLGSAYLAVRYGDSVRPFGAVTEGVAEVGAIVCIIGLLFAIWARVTLGRSWGMPMTLHDDPELVTSGPYRYVRHPIYTALSLMLIGTSLVYPIVILPCLITIVYCTFAARREERDMEQRFPAYAAYRQRSKFIVPFLL